MNTTKDETLLARALAAGWTDSLVTVGDWAVSTMTGTDIDGAILNVRTHGGAACPDCNGRAFPRGSGAWPTSEARDAAYAAAHAHGHLQMFSETEYGPRSMRQAIARREGRADYWRVE